MVSELKVIEAPIDPITLQLDRAGIIRGRCLRDSKPVRNFTILFWRDDPNTQEKLVIKNSDDGSFLIDEAPVGRVVLLATSDESPRSEPVTVSVLSDEPTDVSIELPEPTSGSGKIVDGMTGDPLTSATVQVLVTHGISNINLRPWKTAEHVDPQGAFELLGFVNGQNVIEVAAPGYAVLHTARHAMPNQPLDFGVIGLFSKQSVEVQLVSNGATDFSAYRASLDGVSYVADQPFGADGQLRFAALDPGHYNLRIVFPGEISRVSYFALLPGKDLRLEIPVHTRPVTIEILPELGDEAPQWYYIRVSFADAEGRSTAQAYYVPESRRVEVDGVTGTSMIVRVNDVHEHPLAIQHVSLAPTWPSLVQIRVPRARSTWQIVDASGVPIAGVRVFLSSIDNETGWNEQLITDELGECSANAIGLDRVCIALFHPDHGFQPSTPVSISRSPSRKEILFAPRLRMTVALFENATPLPGVEVLASDHQDVGWGLGEAYSDDRGVATWEPVGPGDFRIQVRHPGYWPVDKRIHIDGDASPIPIQVRRLGNVDISVKNSYGNPASGVAMDLYSVEQGSWASTWISTNLMPQPPTGLTTGDDGHLRINALPNGEFRWRATSPSGATSEGTVQVPPQGTAQLQITSP